MFRIAICDDEAEFTGQIREMLQSWSGQPEHLRCSIFDNGDALAAAHRSDPFDMILLDMVMPLQNGIETAREIRLNDRQVKIIFLTASPEFAVESYSVKANGYLLKPIGAEKLYACLDEIVQEMELSSRAIVVQGIHSVQRIPLDQIEYVKAQNKHILFALRGNSRVLTTDPLYLHEKNLTVSDGFFKCHRSYIVNLNEIDSYSSRELITRSGCRIPVARSVHKEFEDAYFAAIFGKAGESV